MRNPVIENYKRENKLGLEMFCSHTEQVRLNAEHVNMTLTLSVQGLNSMQKWPWYTIR